MSRATSHGSAAGRGEGRGVHDQSLVIAAVEVRPRKPENVNGVPRRNGRYAGRIRMEVVPDRSARSLCGFVEAAVEPGAVVVTDAWGGSATLPDRGYRHLPVAAQGDPSVAEDFLPISHLIFSNLKSWLRGCHHGVSPQHLQRVHVPVQSPFLPVQCVPLIAGDQRAGGGSDV